MDIFFTLGFVKKKIIKPYACEKANENNYVQIRIRSTYVINLPGEMHYWQKYTIQYTCMYELTCKTMQSYTPHCWF